MQSPTHDRYAMVEQVRERLAQIIQRSGLTRSAFARRAGIDRSTLSQILSPQTDRLPRLETLLAIATTEQVSMDWLTGLSQRGPLSTEVIRHSLEIEPGVGSPRDERLARWHAEAAGYKIRYVPTTLPDLFKTDAVIEYEYRQYADTTPEDRRNARQAGLDYQRRPETDTEVCMPIQAVEGLARGEGMWRNLGVEERKTQLKRMAELSDELYPSYRTFLFDVLQRYSVPLTIFGPSRAVVYMGQMYFVLNSREHIRVLMEHFDDLIRAAVLQPPDVIEYFDRLQRNL